MPLIFGSKLFTLLYGKANYQFCLLCSNLAGETTQGIFVGESTMGDHM